MSRLSEKDRAFLANIDLSNSVKDALEAYWAEHGSQSNPDESVYFSCFMHTLLPSMALGYFVSAFVEFPQGLNNLIYFSIVLLCFALPILTFVRLVLVAHLYKENQGHRLLEKSFISTFKKKTLFKKVYPVVFWLAILLGAVLNGHIFTGVVLIVIILFSHLCISCGNVSVRNAVDDLVSDFDKRSTSAKIINI